MRIALFIIIITATPMTISAGDGVLEINQACVDAGCFGGDDPGFPVLISESGSYRLTSNLDVTGETDPENITAITIEDSNVSLDLNGFVITGPVSCEDTPVTSCAPAGGDGYGILAIGSGSGISDVRVENGSINGMGSGGIFCSECRITDVNVTENANAGINTGLGELKNINANRNLTVGLAVNRGSIENSLARGNGATGMYVSNEGAIRDSQAKFNGDVGILMRDGTAVGNFSFFNQGNGIVVDRATSIRNVSSRNSENGFTCTDCLMIDNISSGNQAAGIEFSGNQNAWKGNQLRGNFPDSVVGTAVKLGDNACDDSLC